MSKKIAFLFLVFIFPLLLIGQDIPPSIVKEGNYIITSTSSIINLTAKESILLKPDVWIKAGSDFKAKLINPSIDYIAPQVSNQNYILKQNFQIPLTSVDQIDSPKDVREVITYYDELGNPMQNIAIGLSPAHKDIIKHIEYDELGRSQKDFLPYPSSNTLENGKFRTNNPYSETINYYDSNFPSDFNDDIDNAYVEKRFDTSPLNNVMEIGFPGSSWSITAGNTKQFKYSSNSIEEVKKYVVTLNDNRIPSLYLDEVTAYTTSLYPDEKYYSPEKLFITTTTNENYSSIQDCIHEVFKDKDGFIVLDRNICEGEKYDTYYVYDDFGNLTYVLPPKAEADTSIPSQTVLNELCYQYTYDQYNRLVQKKIPGKGVEYFIYDKLDRPVLTQDAILRPQKKWLYTKYNLFGDVIETGIYTASSDILREVLQETVDTYEIQSGSETFPIADTYPLSYTYYDDYNFDTFNVDVPPNVYGEPIVDNTLGLVTGSKTRVLGGDQWITNINYYDKYAKVTYAYDINHYLGTTDVTQTEYDFVGKILKTKIYHDKTGQNQIAIEDTFEYDHAGRLLSQQQKIDDKPTELIVQNIYGQLGELKTKNVGNKLSNPLQKVDYKYNVRGWLTQINNPSNPNQGDLFNFEIKYDQPSIEGTPLYNGNISQTFWKTLNTDQSKRHYNYSYDALNRLTNANYRVDGTVQFNKNYSERLQYDKNGNITFLHRTGNVVEDGNLEYMDYHYQGNQLQRITETGHNNFGFKPNTSSSDTQAQYEYDSNGNLTKDLNKGITYIEYNHLNLPTIIFIDGGVITYKYDASGVKLQKEVTANGQITTTQYAGAFTYKYVNNNNPSLEYITQPEGYITRENNQYYYTFQYNDHLGNIRLSYQDSNGDGAITQNEIIEEKNYYPFGMKHKGYNPIVSGKTIPFGFNGKEEQNELGLEYLDFDARNYDASIGRWMNVDNVSEQFHNLSPYNYALNNPISFIDPDGNMPNIGAQIAGGYQRWMDTMRYERAYREYKASAGWDSGQIDPPWNSLNMNEGQYMSAMNAPGDYRAQLDSYYSGLPDSDYGKSLYKASMGNASARPSYGSSKTADILDVALMLTGVQDVLDGYNAAKNGQDQLAFQHFSNVYLGNVIGSKFLSRTSNFRAITNGVRNISRSSLTPPHYITKSKTHMKVLFNDIRVNGIEKAIPYVEYNGTKYMVGGHHRYYSAQKLGNQNVPAIQVQLPYEGYKTPTDLILEPGKNPGFWKYIK